MRVYGVYLLLALAGAQNSDGTIDMKTPTISATPFDRSSSGGFVLSVSASASASASASPKPSMMDDSTATGGNRMTLSPTMTAKYDVSPEPTLLFSPRPSFNEWSTKAYTPKPSQDVWPTWDYTPHPTYDEWPTREYSPYPTQKDCICDTDYPSDDVWPTYDYTPYPSSDDRDTTWSTYEFTPHPSNNDGGTSWGNTEQITPYPTRDRWCHCKSPLPTFSVWPSKPPVDDTYTMLPSFSAKPTIRADFETVRPSFSAKPTIPVDETVRPSFSSKPTIPVDKTVRPSFSAKPTIQTDFVTVRPSFSAKPTIHTELSAFPSIPLILPMSLRPTFIAVPTRFPPIDNRTKELIAEIIKTREELQSIITGGSGGGDFNASRAQQFIADIAKTFSTVSQLATGVRDSIDDVQDSFRRVGALVLNVNKSAVFETRTLNFTLRAAAIEDDKKQEVTTEAGSIQLPILPFRNQSISVVEWKDNPYKSISSREISSTVITIMLSDLLSGNETRVFGLSDAINITLPLNEFDFSVFKPMCVYWDKVANDWSSDGCIVKRVSGNRVVCGCTHLTDFSVVSTPIVDSGVGGISSGGTGGSSDNSGSNLNVSNLPIIIGGAIGGLLIVSIIVGFIVFRAKDKKEKILTSGNINNSVVNYLHSGNPSAYSVAGGGGASYMIGPVARTKSAAKISYKPNVIGGIGSMV